MKTSTSKCPSPAHVQVQSGSSSRVQCHQIPAWVRLPDTFISQCPLGIQRQRIRAEDYATSDAFAFARAIEAHLPAVALHNVVDNPLPQHGIVRGCVPAATRIPAVLAAGVAHRLLREEPAEPGKLK